MELPVIIVLGLTFSDWTLHQMLPPRVTDRMATHNIPLARGLERMEAFFESALLSEECRLCFGHALLCDLDHFFLAHDFTARSFVNALQVCCVCAIGRNWSRKLFAKPIDGEAAQALTSCHTDAHSKFA